MITIAKAHFINAIPHIHFSSKKLSQSSQANAREKRPRTSARQRSRGKVGASASSTSNKKTIFLDSDEDDEDNEGEEGVAEDAAAQPSSKRSKAAAQDVAEKGAASRLPAVKENEHNDNDDDCCFNFGNDSKDRTCLNTTSDLTYLGAAKEAALATDENMNLNNISNTTNVSEKESIFEDGQMQDSFVITDAVLRM